jgi:predicted Zn finger-like uncharacterized protein
MDLGEGMGPGANPRYKAVLAVPMATHIICPVCDTRYETKAVFPPEGRKVRCSKCSHVWQAHPVTVPTAPPPPQPQIRPQPQPAAEPQAPPPPPPRPAPPAAPAAPAVNMAMRGFAGISTPAPQPQYAPPPPDAELAAQVAEINAEAMADAPVAAPPEKRGGIFGRLAGRSPAPPPPQDAAMEDASMGDSGLADAGMMDASMGDGLADVGMGDAGLTDADLGIDPALAAQALPEERGQSRARSVVTLGWLALALIVAGVIGTLALAPSTVMSVLPGAARLYALFGVPVGSHGLTFEGVRYGWTNDGGQTVLEVQGDVVNLTSSPVDVPTVIIALRDESGSEISEWTTEIGEDELAAGGHAPFLRQIPSPPSNVRSVKVRFAKAE